MTLSYDFDMFSTYPDEVRAQFQGEIEQVGLGSLMGQQTALFRDPGIGQALKQAEEDIQKLFLDSGFGFNTFDSGAPAGRFPAQDETARAERITRFIANLQKIENPAERNWGGFDPVAFVDYLSSAKPIDQTEMQRVQKTATQQARKMSRGRAVAKLGLVAGCLMVLVSIAGVMN